MNEFRRMLADAIQQRKSAGETLRVVAAQIGGDHSTIANVIAGRAKPPLKLLAGWSRLFPEDQRKRWIQLGYLQHAPPEVQSLVADLEGEVARLRGESSQAVLTSGAYTSEPGTTIVRELPPGPKRRPRLKIEIPQQDAPVHAHRE